MPQSGSTDKVQSRNEVIGTNFQHLVVIPAKRSITKQPYSHITGQNRLQILGAPIRFALGPTLFFSPLSLHKAAVPPQSMMQCPRRPIGLCSSRYYPTSSGSTLPKIKHSCHRKRPSYRGLATYSAIL
ncbi:hypothetical protein M9H77_16430 [Catharanthus roseus]|uniref:Uncharacterized protein n=1 Tax=Catharanthus roseus TaxID=4058 RepID=A0ACC0B1X2_CATRO|nr:hypothetical protein M9H77_16430 [Catharanthus roseus]